MGTVLVFERQREARVRRPPKTDPGCHILIFPGVRIERQTATTEPPADRSGKGQTRRRKRSRAN